MNKIELFAYNLLRNNAKLKNLIRNTYQSFFDLLPREKDKGVDDLIVLPNFFFGFHDHSPFSWDNRLLLSNKLLIPLRMPCENDFLEVGYFSDEKFSVWTPVGRTKAWNYHKGCRLQWINENELIYNDYSDGHLVSVIKNVEDSSFTRIFPHPIDSVSLSGSLVSSFSYSRLEKMMPGYGYAIGEEDIDINSDISRSSGIQVFNLSTEELLLSYTLKDLTDFNFHESMKDAYHFVTHSLFSPDSRFLAFLHRWYKGRSRFTRLLVIDLSTNELFESPTSDMVSHYVWNKNNEIIAFCSIDNVYSHVLFKNPYLTEYERAGFPIINSDGHQSFVSNDVFVSDTYPDKKRMANIFKIDIRTGDVENIIRVNSYKKFQSPNDFKHWACDLHPRMSLDGKWLSFDSVHTGVRSHCVINLIDKENS